MRLVVTLFFLLALCGCSVPSHLIRDTNTVLQAENGEVFNITIERFGKTKFSGLLGLQRVEYGVHYVLLDASGIKLLEAEITTLGEQKILHAKGPMQESKLPEYVATWLRRIYLISPNQAPCSSSMLKSFCLRPVEHVGDRKNLRFTSFLMWDVQQSTLQSGKESIAYSEPWIGIEIVINEI